MNSEELIEKLKSAKGDKLKGTEVTLGDAIVHLEPGSLREVAEFLKSDPDLNFDYLSCISGVDYLDLEREPRFECVYELHSMDKNHSIRLRVGVPEEEPTVPTVKDLWPAAIYPEREIYDMFGLTIEGHDEQKRLLMPEEWEGHPLRRDYDLTTEKVAFSHNVDFKEELVKEKVPIRYKPNQV
jgi:NADH-quinone oxidoreductase subunit C